jgi:hypothetical protein
MIETLNTVQNKVTVILPSRTGALASMALGHADA